MRAFFAASIALAITACASTGRAERIARLSPEGAELLHRNRQFMTERQVDVFLRYESDDERRQLVDSLKIDEMLAQFPPPVQQAIREQKVTLGMNHAAVLLSWGSPRQREFDEDQLRNGNEIERWYYQRNDRSAYVTFTNGVVSDYDDGTR